MRKNIKLLSLLLILFCYCSKSNSDIETYKTVVLDRLNIYADTKDHQVIGYLRFKAKVKIVDNNEIKINNQDCVKIKCEDITGYVYSKYLSERNDIPFVDKVKYDYNLNEFEYNKKRTIDFTKKAMIEHGNMKEPLSNEYYIDDPQIYTFYGKEHNKNVKFIMVIMISKIHKDFNYYTVFTINDKNEYSPKEGGSTQDSTRDISIKDYINTIKEEGF